MTTEELYNIACQVLAQELAERVVEKLLARQKKALVVYTGSNISFDDGLESMRRLRAEGFTFKVLLSRGASRILDMDAIRTALEPDALWIEQPEGTPEALTAQYDTIIVPALTVNTAAHVASCMADAPASAVILDGLMRGKNVIAAVDGCCPDHSQRAARGFHMAEPLKQRLRSHIEILRSYGAHVAATGQLYEKTWQAIRGCFVPQPEQVQAAPAPVSGQGNPAFKGRVLSGSYVLCCAPHTALYVPKGTLVTQLAEEQARRRDVQIIVDET